MSHRSQGRRIFVGMMFLLPNILGFLAFILVPLVMSFGMSFTDWDILRHNIFRDAPLRFTGMENFVRLFTHPQFWQYLGNTFFMMLGLPFAIAGSLGAALLLTRASKFRYNIKPALIIATVIMVVCGLTLLSGGMPERQVWLFFGMLAAMTLAAGVVTGGTVYRTLFYLPNFTAGVATYVLWKKLYNPNTGPVNQAMNPLLEGLSGWVNSMPGLFSIILPVIASFIALVIVGWQLRRLRVARDLS